MENILSELMPFVLVIFAIQILIEFSFALICWMIKKIHENNIDK